MARLIGSRVERAELPCVRLEPPQIQASVTDELAIEGGHVWTTPALQEESGVQLAVGCKSCVRPVVAATRPLALM